MRKLLPVAELMVYMLLATGWHLAHILMLRPAYKTLGDTKMTVLTFFALFFLAGTLKYQWFTEPPLGLGVMSSALLLHAALVMLCFERSQRSSALVAVLLACSACADFLYCALVFFGADWTPSTVTLVVELVLSVAAVLRFFQEPAEVQQRGYRRPARQAAQLR